ncbi:uncharacterized protein C8Q71DRAFT_279517 [Rhodofomes roseus]|uniref:Uncharacterized protein n=1 Tax=Rhodofomes roseus TaxID=34475 RepID=A0ABQ8K530_9APHY|nr:uncharacterized protein C8Q71DRAFT_279517 [Rhodofomes roseus]KAH9832050.1 hypothetical protein C8Q71DRAFT_279517 [Rhodofomes roseus]
MMARISSDQMMMHRQSCVGNGRILHYGWASRSGRHFLLLACQLPYTTTLPLGARGDVFRKVILSGSSMVCCAVHATAVSVVHTQRTHGLKAPRTFLEFPAKGRSFHRLPLVKHMHVGLCAASATEPDLNRHYTHPRFSNALSVYVALIVLALPVWPFPSSGVQKAASGCLRSVT